MFEIFGIIVLAILALLWLPYTMRTGKFGAPFVLMEPEVVTERVSLTSTSAVEVNRDYGS